MTLLFIVFVFAVSVAALSCGQALILGRVDSREGAYWVLWLAGSMILALAFFSALLAGSTAQYGIPADFYIGILIVALLTSAAALWRGARKGAARIPPHEPFLGRVLAVVGIHATVVFLGWCLAYVVLSVLTLSHIH